ncbi:MAG: AAA family ATPase [Synergistaceae bacterium]|jgi:hypothetical protein|nr:AAA family ATPase [Synergistaceae bacterium]
MCANNVTGELPKLSVGISNFEELRNKGCPYVDKTGYIVEMIDNGTFYFLSRPRKFGRSLMISAFETLLSGRREVFRGLAAEDYFDRPGCMACPVVRLNVDEVTLDSGASGMLSSMTKMVRDCGAVYGVEIADGLDPNEALRILLLEIGERIGPAAVLIDAVDAPIIGALHNSRAAMEVRGILREFLLQVKNSLPLLRFVLMTAIARLPRENIFTDVKSMRDISNSSRYAEIFGFTEEEFESVFSRHIDALAKTRGEERDSLILKIRDYYYGYSFDGSKLLYNPYSVLNFLSEGKFKNYWFDNGLQRALSEHLRKSDILADFFRGIDFNADTIETYDIERSNVTVFLLQSGYLSIRERKGDRVTLDYSNKEVLSSMASMIQYVKLKDYRANVKGQMLEKSIESGRVEDLIKYFNLIITDIPLDILVRGERKFANTKPENASASFYHSLLFSLIWSSRMKTLTDGYSYEGRTGAVMERDGHRYMIELRVEDDDEACIHAVGEAMASIRSSADVSALGQGRLTAIAMAVDRSVRRVNRYLVERL